MCINIGVIGIMIISVKNALIDPVTLTFDLLTPKPHYFEDISRSFPTPSLNTLGLFAFELCCRQTKTNVVSTPTS